jgi:hypothetical protein
MHYPTAWDIATFVGTIGLFSMMFYLFVRFLPVISIFEMRGLVGERTEKGWLPSLWPQPRDECDAADHEKTASVRVDRGIR